MYNTLIDEFYEYGIDAWNYALQEVGITMLGQSNKDEIQNHLDSFKDEMIIAIKSTNR